MSRSVTPKSEKRPQPCDPDSGAILDFRFWILDCSVGMLVLVCVACVTEQPRIELTIPSPDKRFVVELHNEPTLDPPQQSMRIGRNGGDLHRVMTVSGDGRADRGSL